MVRNPGRLPKDLQSPAVEIIRGDLTRAVDLEKAIAGSRVVYHLARANVRTWDEFTEQDIEVTRHIAEACLFLEFGIDLHRNDRHVLRGSQGRDHHRDNAAGFLTSPGEISRVQTVWLRAWHVHAASGN